MKLGLAATILGPSMFARISLLQGNLKISHGKQRVPRTSDMDLLTENFWKTKEEDRHLAQEIWESTFWLENR